MQSQIRTRVFVSAVAVLLWTNTALPGNPPAAEGTSRALLQLEDAPLLKSKPYAPGGMLIREILRQSFLIAGRDELGLQTRDAALRESLDSARSAPFIASVEIEDKKSVRMRIERGHDKTRKILFDETIEMDAERYPDYAKLVERCEQLSRTKFVDLLKQQGFPNAPTENRKPARPGPDTQYKLRQMDFVSQWSAVREIHALHTTGRETRVSLGALSRGYANLGHLTDYQCSLAHKAFKARALLYAYRLRSTETPDADAMWHLAYAWALAGRSDEALAAIGHARRLKKSHAKTDKTDDDSVGGPSAPEWADIINAYCHSNVSALRRHASNSDRWDELAMVLAFHAVEYAGKSNLPDMIGDSVIKNLPGCFRVHDAYNDCIGVIRGHSATVDSATALMMELPRQLSSVKDLPESARKLVDPMIDSGPSNAWTAMGKSIPSLVKALAAEGIPERDTGEPSWECLGRMIEDTAFAQVQRRANFLKNWLAVSANEFVQHTKPIHKDHPYACLMAAYGLDEPKKVKAFCEIIKDLDMRSADTSLLRIRNIADGIWTAVYQETPRFRDQYYQIWANHDAIRGDLGRFIRVDNEPMDRARWLIRAAPYDPAALTTIIMEELEKHENRIDDWLEKTGDLSIITLALGDKYLLFGEHEKARYYFQKTITVEPSKAAYRGLAKCYLDENDLDGYVATLKEFIQLGQDFGLDRAALAREAASTLMERRSLERALPFAEEAASSYSAWGLQCAAACYEGLGKYDDAESMLRKCSDRYPNTTLDWYRFCKRSGKGDLDAARIAARKFVAEYRQSGNPVILSLIGMFHVLENEPELAIKSYQAAYEISGDTFHALNAILLAHLHKNMKVRNELCERAHRSRFSEEVKADTMRNRDLIIYEIHNAFKADNPELANFTTIEQLLPDLTPHEQMDLHYFCALYWQGSGDVDKADKLMRRIARMPNIQHWTWMMARESLRSHGKKLPKVKKPVYYGF